MSPHDVAAALGAYGLAGTMWDLPTKPLAADAWPTLLNTVTTQRYPGFLLQAIHDGALAATEQQREQAEDAHETSMILALVLERHLLGVNAALSGAGVDHRVLKGSAYAALVYPDPALRSFGDVDLLVAGADFDTAVTTLAEHGYHRVWPQIREGYDARFGKGATLRDDTDIEVDLHRTFTLGPFGLTVDAGAVLAEVAEFHLGGVVLRALGPDMMFMHACYHAALGDWPPRTLALRDVAQLLLACDVDEARVLEVAAAWQAEAVVAAAVQMAWDTFRLADVTRLSAWAASYRPNPREAKMLATYTGERRSHTAKSLASLRVIPGLRAKAAFLRASLFPTRDFVDSRSASRAAWVRRGLRQAGKGQR